MNEQINPENVQPAMQVEQPITETNIPVTNQTVVTVEEKTVEPNINVSTQAETPVSSENAATQYIPSDDDIVIDEDFQINIEVKPVSPTPNFAEMKKEDTAVTTPTSVVETPIGTEQTGNITF